MNDKSDSDLFLRHSGVVEILEETFVVQIKGGKWIFGKDKIMFMHNDGTVDTIYKNGILYGKKKRRRK